MANAAILTVIMLGLLVVNLRSILTSGRKQFAWFYSICFVITLAILIMNSLGISLYSPSDLIFDIARKLALIKLIKL
jgi:hypothetical protein